MRLQRTRAFVLALCSVTAARELSGASAAAPEVDAKAGVRTIVADDVAVVCTVRDARNFEGYVVRAGARPFVVSLEWDAPAGRSVVVPLDEGDTSRMALIASGASYFPQAVGDDNPPPPPPGGASARTWGRVSALPAFRDGGRFLVMSGGWPRDFLFEVPAGDPPAEALRFEAHVRETSHAVRCSLGR